MENTAATTVRFLPGMSTTMPLAVLLLVVGGVGATAAWVFAVWTGVTRNITAGEQSQAQQVQIQELQQDVERYRAAMDAQLSLLPASGESSSGVAEARLSPLPSAHCTPAKLVTQAGDSGTRLAIRLLQDAAERGDIEPWDVDVIAVVDGFLDQSAPAGTACG